MKLKNELKLECTTVKFSQGENDDPNLNYNLLDDLLNASMNKHIPMKLVKYNKYKHKKSKWITNGILHSINFRDKLYKRLKDTAPTDIIYGTLKTNLKTYNRILKQMIRSAKQQYYRVQFGKYKNNLKKTWDTIKEVIAPSSKDIDFPTHFLVNDSLYNNPLEISNEFNKVFVDVGLELARKIPEIPNTSYHNYITDPTHHNFILKNINETEVSY